MTRLLVIAVLVLGALSCTRQPAPVPRPRAFQRIETPDSVYCIFYGPVATFEINASADTLHPSETALDVLYGTLGARLYTSQRRFKAPENLTEAIDNRITRISLNLGGAQARSASFVNDAGFECTVVTALDPVPTPVQFYACDASGRFVNGAAVFALAPSSADSVAPAVAALERDVIHLLESLR